MSGRPSGPRKRQQESPTAVAAVGLSAVCFALTAFRAAAEPGHIDTDTPVIRLSRGEIAANVPHDGGAPRRRRQESPTAFVAVGLSAVRCQPRVKVPQPLTSKPLAQDGMVTMILAEP